MKVNVGTGNSLKMEAVRTVFATAFPEMTAIVHSFSFSLLNSPRPWTLALHLYSQNTDLACQVLPSVSEALEASYCTTTLVGYVHDADNRKLATAWTDRSARTC